MLKVEANPEIEDIQDSYVAWSDIRGYYGPEGVTFTGMGGATERLSPRINTNRFFVSVPTPTMHDNVRAKIARVAIKFKSDNNVFFDNMLVFDGSRQIYYPFTPFNMYGDKSNSWIRNQNYFDHPDTPVIESCVCIIFEIRFTGQVGL